MFVSVTPERTVKKWRVIVFAVVAALLALFFMLGQDGFLSLAEPWVLLEAASKTFHPEIHRWHDAMWGILNALLVGGSLLALVWQGQRRPLLAQFFALAMLISSIAFIAFDPTHFFEYMPLVALVIFIVAYPAPRTLLNFAPEGRISVPLLALGILAAVVLAPDVYRNIVLQIYDRTSEHGQYMHWLLSAVTDILLAVAGLLASTKRPGWKSLGVITGIAFLYAGAAAVTVPYHPGSWGTIGGVISMLGGINFIVAAFYEARRVPQQSTKMAQAKQQPVAIAKNESESK
jgi:VanZ family protein